VPLELLARALLHGGDLAFGFLDPVLAERAQAERHRGQHLLGRVRLRDGQERDVAGAAAAARRGGGDAQPQLLETLGERAHCGDTPSRASRGARASTGRPITFAREPEI
jgi:hypothetical protein